MAQKSSRNIVVADSILFFYSIHQVSVLIVFRVSHQLKRSLDGIKVNVMCLRRFESRAFNMNIHTSRANYRLIPISRLDSKWFSRWSRRHASINQKSAGQVSFCGTLRHIRLPIECVSTKPKHSVASYEASAENCWWTRDFLLETRSLKPTTELQHQTQIKTNQTNMSTARWWWPAGNGRQQLFLLPQGKRWAKSRSKLTLQLFNFSNTRWCWLRIDTCSHPTHTEVTKFSSFIWILTRFVSQ